MTGTDGLTDGREGVGVRENARAVWDLRGVTLRN